MSLPKGSPSRKFISTDFLPRDRLPFDGSITSK